jgi:hypothetical protein
VLLFVYVWKGEEIPADCYAHHGRHDVTEVTSKLLRLKRVPTLAYELQGVLEDRSSESEVGGRLWYNRSRV